MGQVELREAGWVEMMTLLLLLLLLLLLVWPFSTRREGGSMPYSSSPSQMLSWVVEGRSPWREKKGILKREEEEGFLEDLAWWDGDDAWWEGFV